MDFIFFFSVLIVVLLFMRRWYYLVSQDCIWEQRKNRNMCHSCLVLSVQISSYIPCGEIPMEDGLLVHDISSRRMQSLLFIRHSCLRTWAKRDYLFSFSLSSLVTQ